MKAIQKAQEALRKKREAGEKIERLDPVQKSMRNDRSLRLAINGKCFDCCAGQKREVSLCNIKKCTLWRFRPYAKNRGIL